MEFQKGVGVVWYILCWLLVQNTITSRHTSHQFTSQGAIYRMDIWEDEEDSILDCNHPEKNSGQGSSPRWKTKCSLTVGRSSSVGWNVFISLSTAHNWAEHWNSCNHCSQFQVDCAFYYKRVFTKAMFYNQNLCLNSMGLVGFDYFGKCLIYQTSNTDWKY